MKSLIKVVSMVIFISIFISCKKDEKSDGNQPSTNTSGTLRVKFHPFVLTDSLVFNKNYLNANGDTFNVNMLKYYVSNITVTKSDNSKHSITGSYYLVDHNTFMEDEFVINGIPEGNYKEITFLLGVDSSSNVSGAQAGDLDPAKGMFWDWNSGYIMSRLEGYSPASTAIGKKIIFHVGGFIRPNISMRTITVSFNGNTANINTSNTPTLHIKTDVSEWFKTPNIINFSVINTVMMPGANSNDIADNYTDAFTFMSIQN